MTIPFLLNPLTLIQPREELLEKRVVNAAAFGVILHGASERIFAQMYLFDDAIVSRPGFNFQIVSELLDGLVMRAVNFRKTMRRTPGMTQWLDFPIALLRQIVPFDVELQCAPEGNVEYLKTFTNSENGQPAGERFPRRLKFPAIAFRIYAFVQERRIDRFLA